MLAEFASVVDSVQAASAIQKELKERNLRLPMNRRMEFRIGINLGDIIAEEKPDLWRRGQHRRQAGKSGPIRAE